MVEGKMNCVKYLMFFFNFLFWLSGLILIIIGAIVRDKYGDKFADLSAQFANAPVLIIVVGVIVFVIGFLGCCGAVKENYCMVTTFAVLLALIFILEIVAGALGISYKNKVQGLAESQLDKEIKHYNMNGTSILLNWAQQKLECCGRMGPGDYNNHTSKDPAFCAGKDQGVKSCHTGQDCTNKVYPKGCQEKVVTFVKDNMILVGGVAIGIAFIQLLGIVFACLLMKAIKGEYEVV